MNLDFRSYTAIRLKIKIGFTYPIFLEINYYNPALKKKCFIDSVIDLTLRLKLKK